MEGKTRFLHGIGNYVTNQYHLCYMSSSRFYWTLHRHSRADIHHDWLRFGTQDLYKYTDHDSPDTEYMQYHFLPHMKSRWGDNYDIPECVYCVDQKWMHHRLRINKLLSPGNAHKTRSSLHSWASASVQLVVGNKIRKFLSSNFVENLMFSKGSYPLQVWGRLYDIPV